MLLLLPLMILIGLGGQTASSLQPDDLEQRLVGSWVLVDNNESITINNEMTITHDALGLMGDIKRIAGHRYQITWYSDTNRDKRRRQAVQCQYVIRTAAGEEPALYFQRLDIDSKSKSDFRCNLLPREARQVKGFIGPKFVPRGESNPDPEIAR